MIVLLAKIKEPFGAIFALTIVFSSLFAASCFILAYQNIRPGLGLFRSRFAIRDHPERFFTPRGLFWLRLGKYTVFAGMVTCLVVLFISHFVS